MLPWTDCWHLIISGALIDYFAEYADYLAVALLPEDAAALDDDYQRVTDI